MANKKYLFLVLLFAAGLFFYKKQSTDNLIIVGLFTCFILFFNFNNMKHLEETKSEVNEAIKNLSSLYNSRTI